MPEVSETDGRLSPLLEYFAERLNLVFSYYFFTLEFQDDEDLHSDPGKNARAWVLETIQNACLHTTLIALRDLDDFLTTRTPKSKPDDLKASDFGIPGSLSFLATNEKQNINKLIAHTTVRGAQAQSFRWDIFELTTKGVSQGLEFLKRVEDLYGLAHFRLFTAAFACRVKTESMLAYVAREVHTRRENEDGRPPSEAGDK